MSSNNIVSPESESYQIQNFDLATGTTAKELIEDIQECFDNDFIPYGNPYVYQNLMCQLMIRRDVTIS